MKDYQGMTIPTIVVVIAVAFGCLYYWTFQASHGAFSVVIPEATSQ